MVILLIKETSDAYNMSDELKQIYISAFQKKGMKHNDYMRLIERAERQVLQSGDKILTMGAMNHYVYLVYTGRLSVMKGGQYICKLGENQVIGYCFLMGRELTVDILFSVIYFACFIFSLLVKCRTSDGMGMQWS